MESLEMDERDGKKKLTNHPAIEVNWDGAMAKHSCTDIPCLILFVVFLLGWGGVGIYAMMNGNIDTVLYPADTSGRICGTGAMEKKKYLLYFDLSRCLNPAVFAIGCNTPQACVEKCPSEYLTIFTDRAKVLPFCSPPENETTDLWKTYDSRELIRRDICPAWLLPSDNVLGRCIPKPSNISIDAGSTKDNKQISSQTINDAVSMLGALLNVRDFFTRVASDVEETWWMISIALLSAALACFGWIILMRFLTGIMVWTSIALVHTVFLGALGYSLYRYWQVKDILNGPDNIFQVNYTPMFLHDILQLRDTWISFAVISGAILFICFCLYLSLRKRIQIAIKMIEHGSKAVAHMLCSLFFPVFPFVLHICVIGWFLATGMYMSSMSNDKKYSIFYDKDQLEETSQNTTSDLLATIRIIRSNAFENNEIKSEIQKRFPKPSCPEATGTNSTSCNFQLLDQCDPLSFNQTNCNECDPPILCRYNEALTTEANWMVYGLQWFNLFAFYWAMNFVSSYGEMVLAGVFAKWYWSRDKSKIPCGSLAKSIFNTTVFHLGTLAFGSLIIAIIKMIRTIVTYIESKLKKTKQNDLVRCLLCTCKCCLWMLEKFMKFINRNAYIVCAIKSTNFCSSSRKAFKLIISNPVRTFVLNKMVDSLLLVGKFVIIAAATIVSYFVFHGWFPEIAGDLPTLNFFFTPLIFITVGTYFIASAFFGVYHMAVDTIYLSMLQDLKQNDGTPEKPYMMQKDLQKTMGVMQKFREEELNFRRERLEAENAELQKMLESSPRFRD